MVSALVFLVFLSGILGQVCSNLRERQEWRQLTAPQQKAYLAAVQKLKARPPGPDNAFESWNHDQFAKLHLSLQANNHGKPAFFPWHRLDWGLDSQSPRSSPVLQASSFGGDGDPTTNCVTNGVAAGWISQAGTPSVTGKCLRRQFQFTALWPSEAISGIVSKATTFEDLHNGVENGPWSPNDPVFFLHHGMVDKIWWRWQTHCGAFSRDYPNPDDSMVPFAFTVSKTFDVSSGPFCYTYSKTAGDTPLSMSCPSGQIEPDWAQNLLEALVPTSRRSGNVKIATNTSFPHPSYSSIFPLAPVDAHSYYRPSADAVPPPPRDDRTNLQKLRHPQPIPSNYFKTMGGNETAARQWEAFAQNIIDHLNAQEGYLSPS
ncbi:hypothetical protein HDU91_006606, partial [Kappamyces sp. JEL0680]